MLAPRWGSSAIQDNGTASSNALHQQSLPCGVSESALDAFTRIASRGSCCGLDILDKHEARGVGLPRESILEILGDSATGKSMVLYNYAIDYILPKDLGGLGTPVILVDMAFTLDPLLITEIMGRRIARIRNMTSEDNVEEYNKLVEDRIRESMERLHILRVDSTTDLAAALLSLDFFEATTPCAPPLSKIGAILIDDIATTVLQDKASQPFGGQNLWRALTQLLNKLSSSCGMNILYAKNSLFYRYGRDDSGSVDGTGNTFAVSRQTVSSEPAVHSRSFSGNAKRLEEYLPQEWAEGSVTHRILLQRDERSKICENDRFQAKLIKPYVERFEQKQQRRCQFTIHGGLLVTQ